MAVTRNGGALCGQVAEHAYAVMTSDVAPVTRGVIAAHALAAQVSGQHDSLVAAQMGLTPARLVPPEPLLGWVARRRLNKLATAEPEEL